MQSTSTHTNYEQNILGTAWKESPNIYLKLFHITVIRTEGILQVCNSRLPLAKANSRPGVIDVNLNTVWHSTANHTTCN